MKHPPLIPWIVGLVLIAGFSTGVCLGEPPRGAETITLSGGSAGNVPLPHHRHQQVLLDCNLCHSVFAQRAGVIDEMKAAGALEKKQVMNKQCIKCHRQKKKAGEKAGPTTCKACHSGK